MGRERPARITVTVLIEHQEQLMMVQEAKEKHRGRWNQPGGHIEMESPQEAAVREAKEETGLDIVLLDLFAIYYDPTAPAYFTNYCFRARPKTLIQGTLSEDVLQARWYSRHELLRIPKETLRSPLVSLRIEHWMESKGLAMGFVRVPPKPKI